MTSHKRMHSDSLPNNDTPPTKSCKVEDTPTSSEPLSLANARIRDLESQIKDLHKFINAKGLTRTDPALPSSIRKHMTHQPNAAKILANQIRYAAANIHENLEDQAFDSRRTGVTSDDMSAAMMPFLAEIANVRHLPDGVPLAFDLVMDLARYSYGGLDGGGCGYGERPSDDVVDRLIQDLAEERRELEPEWDFGKVLEKLRKQNKYLAEYGIEGFCESSIGLLSEWEKPASEGVVDLTVD
ncbi:MAG: hypothetical protein Q9168_003474 [Polycauliona sp. 1 TL-2023]